MERLTNRIIIPKEERDIVVFTQGEYTDTIPAEMTHEDIRKVLRKLAEYEEAEEQGLVAVLPVPIGTTVYEFEPLNKIVKGCTARTVIKYTVYDDSIWFNFADGFMKNIEDFGKTIFLTREAAEQKLKEMESDLYVKH